MLRLPLVLGLLIAAPAVYAQSVDAPMLQAGDAWTYRVTTEKGQQFDRHDVDSKVERISKTGMYLDVMPTGAPTPPTEELFHTDWSRSREIAGKSVVTEKPFDFPLKDGKSWDVTYSAKDPSPTYSSETWTAHYVVVGWEDIEVPAGKFHALKVEAEGTWGGMTTGASASSNRTVGTAGDGATSTVSVAQPPHEASGRLYRAYWYVPAAKRAVKSVFEEYSSKGVRSYRQTTEMETVKVSS